MPCKRKKEEKRCKIGCVIFLFLFIFSQTEAKQCGRSIFARSIKSARCDIETPTRCVCIWAGVTVTGGTSFAEFDPIPTSIN